MRNWLPPGSEAWHELPPIQWSHFELNTITNNTENYALLKKHLRSLILKRFPLSSIYSKPIKMFQKFWSHLTTLGTKRETWSELHAVHPQLCNYLLTLLLPVTECLLHVNWYKFCTWGGGGFNNYAENIRHHFKEFYYLGNQALRICATLLYDNMWNTNTIYSPWKHTYNLGTMFPAYCTSSYKSATLRPFWNSSYRYNSKWRSSSVIAISEVSLKDDKSYNLETKTKRHHWFNLKHSYKKNTH